MTLPLSNALPALLCSPRSPSLNSFEFGGNDAENYPAYHQENRAFRTRIIRALGGEEAVQQIPEVPYPADTYEALKAFAEAHSQAVKENKPLVVEKLPIYPTAYMKEWERKADFSSGSPILQTEDASGRKAIALCLVDKKTNRVSTEIIFQRRRETSVVPEFRDQDGSCWVSQVLAKGKPTREVIAQLELLMRGEHPTYLLQKPKKPIFENAETPSKLLQKKGEGTISQA